MKLNNELLNKLSEKDGRVLAPLMLWFMGVPLGLVLVLWLLFFRG